LPFECPNANLLCSEINTGEKEIVDSSAELTIPDHLTSSLQTSLSTTVLLPRKRKERQITMVDIDLRRSLIIKAYNSRFKPSGCGKKNYLGCDMDPPSLSTKVIRNLGEKFCKVALENLTESALCAPKTSNRVIGAKSKRKDDKAATPGTKPP
jgi:hypothetical protein